MFSGSTIITVYFAPKDTYTYKCFKSWYEKTKRRWRTADVLGADEVKILENNRRHNFGYIKPITIKGWEQHTDAWANGKKYEKKDTFYQDVVGDPYHEYFLAFQRNQFGWWGLNGILHKRSQTTVKNSRTQMAIPNTKMLDVSIHLNANSVMDRIYRQGLSYDDAVTGTTVGRPSTVEMIREFTKINKQYMDEETAYKKAINLCEIIQRNVALEDNSPSKNEYGFLVNYYNRFINPTIREMLKIQINFFFLKEVMTHNPNLGLFVLGPNNELRRIQGIVGKRDQNVIISQFKNFPGKTSKNVFEYVYSVSRDTLVNEADKGFIPASKLKPNTSKIQNLMYGRKHISVDHRYKTEMFYSLILDGKNHNGYHPWIDFNHNLWLSRDYSIPGSLDGLEIIC